MPSLDTSTEAMVELSVDMTCGNCEAKIKSALKDVPGISEVQVELENQRVKVTSSKTADELKRLIESTGKTAVIVGVGSGNLGAAVAMLGKDGVYQQMGIQGVIRFTQIDEERCVIEGTVDGLTPGDHGLAVHETGDTSRGCSSLGGHYNPRGARHGSPQLGELERHVGDLGNVVAGSDGRASFRFSDRLIKVWDVIGRSVVVAERGDDFGLGESAESLVNGNCGQGLACGIIARSAGVGENNKKICACDGVTLWDDRNKPLAGPGRRE